MILIYLISIFFSGIIQLGVPQFDADVNIQEILFQSDITLNNKLSTQNLYFLQENKNTENHFHLLLTEPDSEEKFHFKNFNKKYFSLSLSSLSFSLITSITFPFTFNNKSWQVHHIPTFIWNQVFRL